MTDLRNKIATAISDPGKTEGYKGERSLTDWQTDAIMRVLSAQPSPITLSGGGVQVKPLEWEALEDTSYRGISAIGRYHIFPGTGFSYDLCGPVGGRLSTHKRLGAAKSAAQADYEARILSAISPSPVGDAQQEIKKLTKALQPFADAVFNDNGDITVNLAAVDPDDFIGAYFTLRTLRASTNPNNKEDAE